MPDNFSPSIAVVGFSAVFPNAVGADAFWRNIVKKVDATVEVPSDRWIGSPDWVYCKTFRPDMTYSRRACLVDGFKLDPEGFHLNADRVRALDPLHQWVLYASRDALQSCRCSDVDKKRIGLILAAIALPTDISSQVSRRLVSSRLCAAPSESSSPYPVSFDESLCARVVSFPAAVVSHALGLGGVNYTLDAACASSLYALKLACDELQAYRANAMLAGGVSRSDCLYTQIGFSQLRALSASGCCAPFDRSADGLVVGEGAGVMVLKRLNDALAQGDKIYGIIRGIGLSNDMRGNLLAPESSGQLRAMQMAYAQAGWHPHSVDHIECHGAGTPVGDATETQSLRTLWGDGGWQKGQCAIGSIKSMIGHLLTAAGAAGMIKTLLALHHRILPPSLKFEHPPENSALIDSPFRVQTEARPWPARSEGAPRRAAVSAFGFGGINAHVLVEEWPDQEPKANATAAIEIRGEALPASAQKSAIAIVGLDIRLGGIASLEAFQEAVFNGRSVLRDPPPGRWRTPETSERAALTPWKKKASYITAGAANSPAESRLPGGFIDKISIRMGEFQIPPGEIPDILPQQLLMLQIAAGAMRDAGLPLRAMRERMGAIIGIAFDYEATNFHQRWALPMLADEWRKAAGRKIDDDELDHWLSLARDDCGPPLTATRTLGALGGIVASRIAREFRFGGPSFVVSAEEGSGLRALEIAVRMLHADEVDAMLVGAVDLNCDERNLATLCSRLPISTNREIRPFDDNADGTLPGEGAVALVVKRLEDAIAGHDRIYALIEGVGSAGGQADDLLRPDVSSYCASLARALGDAGVSAQQIGLVETHGSGVPDQDRIEALALHTFFGHDTRRGPEDPAAIGTLKPLVGHTGAVSGLASMAKTCLCLYHQMIAPVTNYKTPGQEEWRQGLFHLPIKAAYWAHNRIDGPRRACVAAITVDGHCMHAVLGQAAPDQRPGSTVTDRPNLPATPMGALPHGLFVIRADGTDRLLSELEDLRNLVQPEGETPDRGIASLAASWHERCQSGTKRSHSLAIVAADVGMLETYLDTACQSVATGTACHLGGRGGVCYLPDRSIGAGQVAFVYPGSGNHYVGMGRVLGVYWPDVLREMDRATDRFKSQMLPRWYDPFRSDWTAEWPQASYAELVSDPLRTIFGQVLFGGHMTALLRRFGLQPDAVIGYSLGESAGLFAMGAWPDRGAMLERLEASDLFKTQLAGPCQCARDVWGIPSEQPVDWRVAAVNRSKNVVDEAISGLPGVRRLIVNTPTQCVIGGLKEPLKDAIAAMKCEAVFLDGVVTVHCDAAQPAAEAYKALHRFPTTPVPGVRFYSCAFEGAYDLTTEAAAESITRQALEGFDFPRTIQQAYADGIRIFVEIGPHCSCTRMIEQILADQPHLAVAANQRSEDEPLTMLKCLGTLAAAGFEIDLKALYGYPQTHQAMTPDRQADTLEPSAVSVPAGTFDPARIIDVPVGGRPLVFKRPFPAQEAPNALQDDIPIPVAPQRAEDMPKPAETDLKYEHPADRPDGSAFDTMITRFKENVEATARAHEQFLEMSRQLTIQYGEAFDLQNQLLAALQGQVPDAESLASMPEQVHPKKNPDGSALEAVAFNREQCLEFATGSVGRMLGPDFDIVDSFKARVRLPDEPLMLVDRILTVEGEKLTLGGGRVVTEHDVLPGAWYLDGDRAPVCISVEAGQADLFLCAYLGIDHKVRGERTYRLLDARIRFHRGLPRPGETIRYDIHIDKFVRQEETYLFFFRFEGHIGREHLITMTNGCAGFFTEEEVRKSGGIFLTQEDKEATVTLNGTPFEPLLPTADAHYEDSQIEALRRGDAAACFGPDFNGMILPPALRLPGGRMRLIHRVVELAPQGGRFGKGFIKAEADIHPDDWFLTCHFVDDMVMPGTLMYECCGHTLRVLLMRLGWITDNPDVAYEPVRNLDCRLKCRGPVTPRTRHVHYAVEIKEIGYHPEPYVIADAHMYADGRYIVFFKDMSMQMTGICQQDILSFWKRHRAAQAPTIPAPEKMAAHTVFTKKKILAFAVGKPSEAFGRPYEVFDRQRRIARLPGPPYCFIDRITRIDPQPWVLAPDGWVEAQYDVPADAWYFAADRSGVMPFAILLEIALQPCGWLAAFAGSALRSPNDLKFRNLGGQAVVHANVLPENRTLTMRTRMSKVSEAADMIIEHFEFQVLHLDQPIYTGHTYFGFFTEQALAQQVGLREPAYAPSPEDLCHPVDQALNTDPPFTPDAIPSGTLFRSKGLQMPSRSLCMLDGIDIFNPTGGPHGLGFVRGHKRVDVDEWFFKAHFFQDPVCPGSLGVESFLQLIKYAALMRWPNLRHSHRFEILCGREHCWSYRGQVIPTNQKVMVDAVITCIEDGDAPVMMADGWLQADGISIYKMEGYGIRIVPLS